MRTWIVLIVLLSLPPLSLAAGPVPVHDGDRVLGTLPAPDAEIGLVLDALEGSVLSVKARAAAGVEPEVRLFDPSDVEIRLGPWTRHGEGSAKTKLRKLPLPETGRYTLVVTSRSSLGGDVDVRIRLDHPRKIRDEGTIPFAGGESLVRFPAFPGTGVRYSVSARDGFLARADTLLLPGAARAAVPEVQADGSRVRGRGYVCEVLGDHSLVVAGRDGSVGSWKAVVKLAQPVPEPRILPVEGEAAGTFTDGMLPPPELPPPGGGGGGGGADIRNGYFHVSLSMADPPPEPKGTGVPTWSRSLPLDFVLVLENVSGQSQSVPFVSEPWHNILVRDLSGNRVWLAYEVTLPVVPTVVFPPRDQRIWIIRWDLPSLGAPPAGDYEATAVFQTLDPRIPQGAKLRFRLQ
jgi:hypothetical protein